MTESHVDIVYVIQENGLDGEHNDCVAVCADEETAEAYRAKRQEIRGVFMTVEIKKMAVCRGVAAVVLG